MIFLKLIFYPYRGFLTLSYITIGYLFNFRQFDNFVDPYFNQSFNVLTYFSIQPSYFCSPPYTPSNPLKTGFFPKNASPYVLHPPTRIFFVPLCGIFFIYYLYSITMQYRYLMTYFSIGFTPRKKSQLVYTPPLKTNKLIIP